MLYLLDASVLIDADQTYYPPSRIPEFWDWLAHMAKQGSVKMPRENYDEVKAGSDDDPLYRWLRSAEVAEHLLLNESLDIEIVRRVSDAGYAPDLTDNELELLGQDPFLIAYALVDRDNRTVVTMETSKPSRQRANRRIPDVCRRFGIKCCNVFGLIRELDFTTSWRPR